jgi:predicted ATPase
MISVLEISDFRNHRSTRLEFERFSVIAGPNGVGKSNALRALQRFSRLSRFRNIINTEDVNFLAHGQWLDSSWEASIPSRDPLGSIELFNFKTQSGPDVSSHLEKIFSGWFLLKPRGQYVAATYSEVIPPVLNEDGSGLASVIAHLMTADPDSFARLLRHFQAIIPAVRRVRATREKVVRVRKKTVTIDGRDVVYDEADEVNGDALRFDMASKPDLPASEISEGTLIVLTILTAIFQSRRPQLLLIDDLECGLHPSAQETLVRQLRQIQVSFPELQVIATTHSPYILNECSPEEIILMSSDDEGFCGAKRLFEHPKWKRMKGIMTPGEFWSSEGERWVIEKPEPEKKSA